MKDVTDAARRHGFTVLSSEQIPEVDGFVHVMVHDLSKARLIYIDNEDLEKAFSIAFKTPAADDTGVFHILEHSVLCGSRKFPVKEPFVNLLKSSMQTFLNALTFPDKTMYPVASTNERDLINLMDVYLDAVFHPLIYDKKTIFEQEGWHLELADPGAQEDLVRNVGPSDGDYAGAHEADDMSQRHPVVYNGVVYNEMKGVLSDPDSVLYDTLMSALFPDVTYRFESGGTPSEIPALTYEDFLENHSRHYRPENSYITLYGALNLDTFLSFLDEEYLAPLAGCRASSDGADSVNPLEMQAPVVRRKVSHPMATTPENACAALGYVIGTSADYERVTAAGILLDAIMGSNEAYLKRALLDADLAADAVSSVADSMAQPTVIVELKGMKPGSFDRFYDIVTEVVARLVKGELDHELVSAAIAHAEFVMREHDFGYADGVVLAISAMSGWLYDDDAPTTYLRYEEVFAHLRTLLDEGYFERLASEIFLENDHFAEVEIVPCAQEDADSDDERLSRLAHALSSDDLKAIEADVEDLRLAQEIPDAPEDLAKLPQLCKSDITEAPVEPSFELDESMPLTCLRHDIPTHGIVYAYRYFDMTCLSFDELSYVTVLAMVLGKLDTAHHSARELDTLVQAKLGNLSFYTEVFEDVHDRDLFLPKFSVSASALAENVEVVAALANEVLMETDFSDYDKIRDILMQRRVAMEQNFVVSGQSVAMTRVGSYFLPAAVVSDKLGGIEFYRFLCDLCDHYDERVTSLCTMLADLSHRLFVEDGYVLSFTGGEEELQRFLASGVALGCSGADAPRDPRGGFPLGADAAPVFRHEAFIVPTDVSFSVMGFDRRELDSPYTGTWPLASNVLSYDYLWNEVRVKGGAYGTGFQASRSGSLLFHSYRDPHIDETIERFCHAGTWLSKFSPSPSEMDGYIVSTTAGMDKPLKARELMHRQDRMFFAGFSPADRRATREEVIASGVEDVRALADVLTCATDQHMTCVVGNRDLIERSEDGFDVVNLLNA